MDFTLWSIIQQAIIKMKFLILALVLVATFQWSRAEEHIHVERIKHGLSGQGTTTRYWDCCKPSCGWKDNLVDKSGNPVNTCTADGSTVADPETASACVGGSSYMCSNQAARAINDSFAIGYAAGSFTGGADTSYCCACFRLEFQGALAGKQMVVQVTNTGGDLGSNQFDLAIPGGGVGIFTDGCSSQWGCPSNGWGDQYGGVGSDSECSTLPSSLQSGCHFRFTFMNGVSNPAVNFEQVTCPGDVTSNTGCNYPS